MLEQIILKEQIKLSELRAKPRSSSNFPSFSHHPNRINQNGCPEISWKVCPRANYTSRTNKLSELKAKT